MSRVTPENKIKKMVRDVFTEFPALKHFWPVPSGFGASDLDCIVCYFGRYIAIETKAPGKRPTPRQELTIIHTKVAGGMVFVIDSEKGVHELRVALQGIKDANNR